ncbi:hypothetical protein E2C01_056338 [Portunus trituberculatus]|uniref:Uncharacterized protein n=1 Tax=Portunus trituberculatus TaxID=210409 RepID=A0A5B7GXT3_PORTR|nr:hypothetical protein [Portunus trituberculatus]
MGIKGQCWINRRSLWDERSGQEGVGVCLVTHCGGTPVSDHANPSGAKAPEGLAYPYDRCRGKLARSLCLERDGRIPLSLFSALGVLVGLQTWLLPVRPFLE